MQPPARGSTLPQRLRAALSGRPLDPEGDLRQCNAVRWTRRSGPASFPPGGAGRAPKVSSTGEPHNDEFRLWQMRHSKGAASETRVLEIWASDLASGRCSRQGTGARGKPEGAVAHPGGPKGGSADRTLCGTGDRLVRRFARRDRIRAIADDCPTRGRRRPQSKYGARRAGR